MCCIFLTFRGAAYFGTSMQMLVGLALFLKYLYDLLFDVLDYNNVTTMAITTILLAYGLLVLSFGLLIFRGLEKGSLTLLKVSVGGFTMLQILILITHFVLIVVAFEQLNNEEKTKQIAMLLFNLIYSFIHLSVLYIYIVRLAKNLVLLAGCSASEESEGEHSARARDKDREIISSAGKQCYINEYNSLNSLNSLTLHSHHHHRNNHLTHARNSSRHSTVYNPSSSSPQVFEGQWENLRDDE